MIALDSSSLIAYLGGEHGADVDAVELAFEQRQGVLPPVVLSEMLSERRLPLQVRELLLQLPLLEVEEGYWERAGLLRSLVLQRGRRAPLADALIAQSCLDHNAPLVTRDADFSGFARLAGLRLFGS
ncbi:MAG TPA: PIN domain-containing protein [Methylomirabilota bacterium]|nr:PIN domain-containing protein [Methylomirabilota bacterium]